MRFFLATISILFLGFVSQAQQGELTSVMPKNAPADSEHRNKFDEKGRKQGKWQYFSRNGILILEYTYSDNKRNGEYVRYNGVTGKMIEKGNYLKGIKNGTFTKWFSNGEKRVEGKYSKGQKDALWSYYFKGGSGAIRLSGKFSEGKKEGNWIIYDKGGSIRKKVIYNDGRLIKNEVDSTQINTEK